jgi:hypothetical protein
MRAVALHPRQHPQRPGFRAAIHCAIPRTYRWAGAATPTQRNTTRALDRAGRASDVIKISDLTSENKPPWLLVEPSVPTRMPRPRAPAGTARADTWTFRARFRALAGTVRAAAIAGRGLLDWLAAAPRRLGDRLFAMNDAEACWRGWQITGTHGGLGRRYRDPQFGTLAEGPKRPGEMS